VSESACGSLPPMAPLLFRRRFLTFGMISSALLLSLNRRSPLLFGSQRKNKTIRGGFTAIPEETRETSEPRGDTPSPSKVSRPKHHKETPQRNTKNSTKSQREILPSFSRKSLISLQSPLGLWSALSLLVYLCYLLAGRFLIHLPGTPLGALRVLSWLYWGLWMRKSNPRNVASNEADWSLRICGGR